MKIGKKFKLLRMVAEFSIEELSENTGIAKGVISGFESGKKEIGAENFITLCDYAGIDSGKIAQGDPYKAAKDSLNFFFAEKK